MNRIFYALVAIAFLFAAFAHVTWRPAEAEVGVAITRLSSGRALAVGPWSSALYDGVGWRDTAWSGRSGIFDLEGHYERQDGSIRRHAALAPLPDGGALLVGGWSAPATVFNTFRGYFAEVPLEITSRAQRWDAGKDRWIGVDPVPEALAAPAVVAIGGDPVLLGGEDADGPIDSAWRFDSASDGWVRLPRLPEPRAQAVAVTLADGDWLLVGGLEAGSVPADDALRFDQATRSWAVVAGPRMPRLHHAAALLPTGEVLVVGGENPDMGLLRSAEIWDPTLGDWRVGGQMVASRLDPALIVDGGKVVVAGGSGPEQPDPQAFRSLPGWLGGAPAVGTMVPLTSAEVREDGSWRATAPLKHARVGAVGMVVSGRPTAVGGGVLGASFLQPGKDAWSYGEPLSPMGRVGQAMLDRAESAVMKIVLPLIGGMTLFLGAMKVAEAGGLMVVLARLIRPIMVRLFPEVPPDHPAMGAMILNMAANALGLGNAATPFGIRAMEHLDTLNPRKGTATNAMALFLAINTSNVTILPTGVIVLRAINGSADPGGILVTTLFATICSTTVAILAAKTYQRFVPKVLDMPVDEDAAEEAPAEAESEPVEEEALPDAAHESYPWWVSALVISAIVAVVPLAVIPGTRPFVEGAVPWIIPVLIAGLLSYGFFNGVPVYETFVAGAKDGWNVAVKIIPFVVGILVVIAMLQASGAMDAFTSSVGPFTSLFGLPADALPMAVLRPLSGSGAMGVMISTISDPSVGPDSYTGYLVSTFQGSTETTFYVIAVYFGAVGVKRLRHSLAAALTADVAGVIGAIVICSILYGSL